jgi:maleylacetoacetate isomerase/maleylpyruvate isomerase
MTATPRFELFAYWRTSATYRVRVALNLKGLAASERIINIDTNENRGEDFLRINPLGAIPALIDLEAGKSSGPITQSAAILEYLDEVHPEPPLLPATPLGRARVRSLSAMLTADTHPLITPRIRKYLTSTGKFDADAWRAWMIHWFTTGLQAFEQRLESEADTGTFCHGESITAADICLASIMAMLPLFKIEIADIPTITRIFTACQGHEAFAKAAPALQAGAPAQV